MQKNITKFLTISILLFVLIVFFISLNKVTRYDTKKLVGNKISDISLELFEDEELLTDKDLKKNDFTLINFWASWCSPCRQEHPFLLRLSEEKNLKILGVNFKDNQQNALKFLNDLGNPYDYVTKDISGKNSIYFGIYGIPESILVNEELIKEQKFVGPISEKDYKIIKNILRKK